MCVSNRPRTAYRHTRKSYLEPYKLEKSNKVDLDLL
jgi:hypothetical protein